MIDLPRILCPVDFSEFSQRALDRAFTVARCYKSTVTALHVVTPMPVAAPGAYYLAPRWRHRCCCRKPIARL